MNTKSQKHRVVDSSSRAPLLIKPENVETIAILGPMIQFLTGPADEHAPCVMRGTIPPGVSVPLHTHANPETFLVLSGEIEGLTHADGDVAWTTIRPGDIFHVPGGAKHAFRNLGHEPAVMMVISTSKSGRFFQELGVPAMPGSPQAPPSAEDIRHFLETSAKYGYWNATPEENARVGVPLPPVLTQHARPSHR